MMVTWKISLDSNEDCGDDKGRHENVICREEVGNSMAPMEKTSCHQTNT